MSKNKQPRVSSVNWRSLKEELTSATELLHAQVEAGLARNDVLEALFNSTIARLSNVGDLSPSQLTELTQLVNKGPWTPAQKKKLASHVGNKLVQDTVTGEDNKRAVRKLQSCPYFENFITEATWRFIRSPQQTTVREPRRSRGLGTTYT